MTIRYNQISDEYKQQILNKCPYQIRQGNNGRWYTFLLGSEDDTDVREASRKTREELEEHIIRHYLKHPELLPYGIQINICRPASMTNPPELSSRTVPANALPSVSSSGSASSLSARSTNADYHTSPSHSVTNSDTSNSSRNHLKIVWSTPTPKTRHSNLSKAQPKRHMTKTEQRIVHYLEDNYKSIIDLGILLHLLADITLEEVCTLKLEDIRHNNHLIHVCRYEPGTNPTKKDAPSHTRGIRDVVIRDSDRWILDKVMELRSNKTEFLFERRGFRCLGMDFQRRYTELKAKFQR